jgi:hypothetical protein
LEAPVLPEALPEGDAVPVTTEADAHALVLTGNAAFAPVVELVPGVGVPGLHAGMSCWDW